MFVVHAGTHSPLQNLKSMTAISCNNVNICFLTSVNLRLFFSFLVGTLSSYYFYHTDHSVTFLHVCLETVMDEGCRGMLAVQSGSRVA